MAPKFEERFILEPVMLFDETLTDAIEGILDTSVRKSGTPNISKASHAETPSNAVATVTLATPPVSTGYSGSGDQMKFRTDCRQVVAEALEEVVKSVNKDRKTYDRPRNHK